MALTTWSVQWIIVRDQIVVFPDDRLLDIIIPTFNAIVQL
jgi:hypothetical protein